MKLFGLNFGKEKQPEPAIQNIKGNEYIPNPVEAFNFAIQNEYMPSISSYVEANGFIKWGHNNLFPLQLADLYNSSPIHQSITLQKSLMVVGDGIKYNQAALSALNPNQTAELSRFDSFADGCEKSLQEIASELELDYQIFGAFAIEVFWNTDFTKIIKINRLPVVNIRLGVEDGQGKIQHYYYNKDWTKQSKYGTVVIPAFNIMNRASQNQILYVKNPSIDGRYYGTPSYASGLNWIAADAGISRFHLANITNGMAPSLAIKFFKLPPTPEDRAETVRNIKREYTGQGNAGKAMIFFSDGKDLAPEVEPVEVNNIDKQFTVIASQIVEQIVRCHRAVSGLLFGVESIAKITSVNQYEDAFRIFEKTVISYDRRVLENTLNRILKINGLNVGLEFKPFTVFNSIEEKA